MHDIFLSYASADRDKARRLAEALQRRGWSVWWDRDIPPGKSFDQVIEEAIAAARCVVVVWSKGSVDSHWVKTEAAEGLQRKVLVPALVDEVKIPLEFRRIQAASLLGWDGSESHPEFAKLCASIGSVLETSAPPPAATPAREPAAAAPSAEPESMGTAQCPRCGKRMGTPDQPGRTRAALVKHLTGTPQYGGHELSSTQAEEIAQRLAPDPAPQSPEPPTNTANAPEPGRRAQTRQVISRVVATLLWGLLAMIVFPTLKTVHRARAEASTRAHLAVLRDALRAYYFNRGNRFSSPFDISGFSSAGKHLRRVPQTALLPYHSPSARIDTFVEASNLNDSGNWAYKRPSRTNSGVFNDLGSLFIDCTHTDSKGKRWADY